MSYQSVSMTKLKNDLQVLQADNKRLKSGTDIRREKIKYSDWNLTNIKSWNFQIIFLSIFNA